MNSNHVFPALLLAALAGILAACESSREQVLPESATAVEEPAVHFTAVANADGETATFTLENRTRRPVAFWGYSDAMPQLWVERETEGAWEQTGWDWCGTGIEERVLAAGASVSFEYSFRKDDRAMRLGTHVFAPGAADSREKIWSTSVAPAD